MPLVLWTPRLSVGVESLDEQHRRLIAVTNQLHDAMREGRGHAVVSEVCAALGDYARDHFAFEEDLLRRAGYPALEEHQVQHRAFAVRLEALQAELTGTKLGLSLEVLDFLRTWLTDHILGHDHRYAAHLKSSGIGDPGTAG